MINLLTEFLRKKPMIFSGCIIAALFLIIMLTFWALFKDRATTINWESFITDDLFAIPAPYFSFEESHD
jgi:hypothetical protein